MNLHLPDPTDWSNTPLAPLTSVDALLRCQICKDFFASAVLTTCAHTFCSLCIRRCLSAEGRCPSCNTPEQESRLRRNGLLQEVVDTFVDQRDGLLKTARSGLSVTVDGSQRGDGGAASSRSKRKRPEQDAHDEPPSRRTRSRRAPSTTTKPAGSSNHNDEVDGLVVVDSDDDYAPQSSVQSQPEQQPDPSDGLVSCPSCGKRMKEEYVFTHLDHCTGDAEPPPHASRIPPGHASKSPPPPTPQRLPQLSYNLLKDNALRKKLEELKIPSGGPRSLLTRRHSEWLALWNANCDSNHPKSRHELLRELDAWERSQGGRSANGGSSGEGIKGKEFDSAEYNRRHGTEFVDLIAQARASRSSKQSEKRSDDNADGSDNQAQQSTDPPQMNDLDEPWRRADPTTSGFESTLENPFRRGSTAPPSTGPLKVSQSLHDGPIVAPAPPDVDAPPLPALTHQRTAPEPRAPSPETRRLRQQAQPTINPLLGHPVQYSATDPAPAGRRGSVLDGTRTMPMFELPGEPVVDSELEMGSR